MRRRRPGAAAGRAALAVLLLGACALGVRAQEDPVATGGLTALPALEPGPSLLDNGGFERRAGTGPAGWSLGASDGAWSLDPAASRSGLSLRLRGQDGQRVIPAAEQAVQIEPGFYTLEGWVRTEALGRGDERSGVRLCLDGRPQRHWWKCTGILRGTVDWSRVEQPLIAVTRPGRYRVVVGGYGLPDGTAWFDDVALRPAARPPLDAFLLHPNYRGLLFDDRAPVVRVALRVAATPGRPDGRRVELRLLDEATGQVRVRRDYPAAAGLTGELDTAALPAGGYRLRAELVEADGRVVHRHPDHRVVKVPARLRDRLGVWYDERNVTWLGGQPAFVLGLYTTSGYSTSRPSYALGPDGWGTARMAEAPVNMVINYWLGATPIPALTTYLDELGSRRMWLLHTVNFYHPDHPQYRTIPYPAAREGGPALNRWVARTLGRHPALAGFYTADERPADMVARVFAQYGALREGHPGGVTYAVLGDGWEEQAPLWRDAADVLGLDPYPISRPAGQNHLALVGEWTRLGQEAVQGGRPVWMVIQFFQLTGAGGWPSRQDLKAMSWMAIVEGARGLFYWSFGNRGLAWVKDPALREQRWRELVQVTREIKALEPVLLAPDAPVVRDHGAGPVRVLGKRLADGTRYLFAYNATGTVQRVAWTLAEPVREVADLDGGPGPAAGDGRLAVELGPYEVRRYRLR